MPAHHYPRSNVFYRSLRREFPLMVRGEGCWLVDELGKRYLDGSGGAFAANLGHGVEEIAQAMSEQARRVAYVSGAWCTNEAVEAFAAALALLAPGDLDYVYPLSSGSEAVEAALKLAKQYWVEMGKPRKHRIVALSPSYHGNTLLALSASAREHYRRFFGEWLVDVALVPAPYSYRCECGGREPACPACSGDALESALVAAGPDTVAAFIAEPVGGSSTGASVPRPEYFKRVREICDRHDVLFIADEILCGAGRTGSFAAIEHFGVLPDIAVFGKGISGGYAPLSAVVAPRRIVDAVAGGAGALMHAQTFSHHAVSCAAGVAALEYIAVHDLVARCASTGARFLGCLQTLLDLPHVGDVRGIGLLAGVEFVADVRTRAPFPRGQRFAERFTENAQREGLIVWPNVGQAGGVNGDLAMLAPPFSITDSEIGELVSRFGRAVEITVAEDRS